MPTRSRATLPSLIPLLLACTALFALTAYLLGGSPTARAERKPLTEAAGTVEEPSGNTPPIACVVIDAGHGGEDGGAVSAGGLKEKEVNLAVALSLRDLFEAAGVPVIMTRTDDRLLYDRGVNFSGRKKVLDLAARRIIGEKASESAAEGGGESLFISIHMNAFPQSKYSGAQVWYGVGDPRSLEVAENIQNAARQLMPRNTRRIKAAGSNIYLLHRISSPAVLPRIVTI
jgi:N-acetylmuramoyl-L-alanine amidase